MQDWPAPTALERPVTSTTEPAHCWQPSRCNSRSNRTPNRTSQPNTQRFPPARTAVVVPRFTRGHAGHDRSDTARPRSGRTTPRRGTAREREVERTAARDRERADERRSQRRATEARRRRIATFTLVPFLPHSACPVNPSSRDWVHDRSLVASGRSGEQLLPGASAVKSIPGRSTSDLPCASAWTDRWVDVEIRGISRALEPVLKRLRRSPR
jgi:hypothetical protein